MGSVSDEEVKSPNYSNQKYYKLPLLISDEFLTSEDKEKMALFYIHLNSNDKETINLINRVHNGWLKADAEYENNDRVLQRDNITARIPAHLDEEDKKKFELIKQHSTFTNEAFYEQYIKPESIEIMRRDSSNDGKEAQGLECMKFELDDDGYADEFDDDDLDSLLLSNVSIPTLQR
eukprot:CAMPEP_0205834342 /NCGR_PEP_ID=MMETSP0206-20130828/50684_1 /ASSEMBLY_ACC=CAM_ASM_000279 /TAXON_ID=36767 /ORGANISM="Euplotes focardii, Strain TN1" /LENGTH=176 /DNA_ID=CAMNT_0053141299 /DNA_START=1659 /DNA_END=2189 /DNA_ORIENTATION=-